MFIPKPFYVSISRHLTHAPLTAYIKIQKRHYYTPPRANNPSFSASNKNIKKSIQKITVSYKDWHEMLPFELHGYLTSVHTSIEAPPFSLVYRMEAILPFEVEIPSLRILAESGLKELEWAQARFDQLNLIEGKLLKGLAHTPLSKPKGTIYIIFFPLTS